VVREPALPAREDRASRPFRWTRSALSIGELILAREDQGLHAAELAGASDWPVPQAANVLKALDGQGWTVKHGGLRGPRVYRELVAPYATTTPSIHIYVADEDFASPLTDAIEQAGLREVDEDGLVTFWATDARVLKLASQIEDVPVVSASRLYADISSFTARGQDAADHLKEQLIDPLHRANDAAGDSSG